MPWDGSNNLIFLDRVKRHCEMSVYLFFIFFIFKSIMADECIRGAYKEHAKAKKMTQGIRGTKTMTCTMSLLNAMRD